VLLNVAHLAFVWCVLAAYPAWRQSTGGGVLQVPSAEYPTLEIAIDRALPGSTILVAPGTYSVNLVLSNRDLILQSSDRPGSTVLDGGGLWPVIQINGGFANVEIDGFALTNGGNTLYGGAVRAMVQPNPATQLTLRNCIFTDNIAQPDAGAMGVAKGGALLARNFNSLTLEGNRLENNMALTASLSFLAKGGSAFLDSDNPASIYDVRNNTFVENQAEVGGALYIEDKGFTTFEHNRFNDNLGTDQGGALAITCNNVSNGQCAYFVSYRNTFAENQAISSGSAYAEGGAISIVNTVSQFNVMFVRNTIYENFATVPLEKFRWWEMLPRTLCSIAALCLPMKLARCFHYYR
jgi:hypothetical protein